MDALIVIGSVASAAVFVLAWLTQPTLRAWLEHPKYAFDKNVRRYDRTRHAANCAKRLRSGDAAYRSPSSRT